LQHRGQEAAGIVTYDGKQYHGHRAPGHVGDIFSSEEVIKRLPGDLAVGHNRYSTTGETAQRNIQPLFAEFESGGFALAHNGNLTNAQILHRDLVKRGCLFQSTTDTEVIIHLIAISDQGSVVDRLIDTLKRVVGAYSLVAMTHDKMIGVRDPMGVRPLVLGVLDGAHVLASESCALDIIGADFVRDVEPGEMLVIDKGGLTSLKPFGWTPPRLCVFEYIYFARPDSIVDGSGVYEARKRIGAELARESHIDADVVIPVPDSGVPSAMGYANETGLPYELGIIRNHYVGRTFIEPSDNIRHLGVKLKHNASRAVIEGKRVVLVDDSIVRGTTSVKIVEMIRNAGAKEVHMRISSPPTTHSCFYGVDTPERDQLLAAQHSVEEMRKFMRADSLAFVSIDGLYRAMGQTGRDEQTPQYCDACFTGDYPVSLIDREGGETIPQLSFLTNLG
jgi:amidophosphoribosyltransferase